jgi:hypothetical protein
MQATVVATHGTMDNLHQELEILRPPHSMVMARIKAHKTK